MRVFKGVVFQWPPFGTNFQKKTAFYPISRVEMFTYAPDWMKCLSLEISTKRRALANHLKYAHIPLNEIKEYQF